MLPKLVGTANIYLCRGCGRRCLGRRRLGLPLLGPRRVPRELPDELLDGLLVLVLDLVPPLQVPGILYDLYFGVIVNKDLFESLNLTNLILEKAVSATVKTVGVTIPLQRKFFLVPNRTYIL